MHGSLLLNLLISICYCELYSQKSNALNLKISIDSLSNRIRDVNRLQKQRFDSVQHSLNKMISNSDTLFLKSDRSALLAKEHHFDLDKGHSVSITINYFNRVSLLVGINLFTSKVPRKES